MLEDIRARHAPEPGDPLARQLVCKQCGVMFWDWRTTRKRPCPACCAVRQQISNDARRIKAGPEWERTVRGQLAYWVEAARQLGITPET